MIMAPRKNDRSLTLLYKPEFASQAEKLCALGFTNAELAEFFGVEEVTIDNWQARRPGFARALARGRKRTGERPERSLYRRAIGYTREVVKPFFSKNALQPVLVRLEEHVPPNAQAALAWLKIHFPEAWGMPEENADQKSRPADSERTFIVLPENGREWRPTDPRLEED
jgi:hypothetical protein